MSVAKRRIIALTGPFMSGRVSTTTQAARTELKRVPALTTKPGFSNEPIGQATPTDSPINAAGRIP